MGKDINVAGLADGAFVDGGDPRGDGVSPDDGVLNSSLFEGEDGFSKAFFDFLLTASHALEYAVGRVESVWCCHGRETCVRF